MKDLILASSSPRRKELLEKCGIPFLQEAADIDETLDASLPLEDAIQQLAYRKAEAVLNRHPECMVIGSDTIVTIDQKVLGKPKNPEDLKRMLHALSGRRHEVITGLCILSSRRYFQKASVSHVAFAPLSEEEIEAYAKTKEPYDKAGGYAVQGTAGKWITHIEGDFYAIMGLPLSTVYEELKNQKQY